MEENSDNEDEPMTIDYKVEVEQLKILIKTKEEILNQKEMDNSHLITRVNNLERLLSEKDKCIGRLAQQVERMSEIGVKNKPKTEDIARSSDRNVPLMEQNTLQNPKRSQKRLG